MHSECDSAMLHRTLDVGVGGEWGWCVRVYVWWSWGGRVRVHVHVLVLVPAPEAVPVPVPVPVSVQMRVYACIHTYSRGRAYTRAHMCTRANVRRVCRFAALFAHIQYCCGGQLQTND